MSNKNVGKSLVGVWNTKTIVAVAIGAALFGVLMNYGGIPVFTNTSLTTAMIVPVVVGAMYGALPAAVAAGVGNVIADLIGGWGLWFDWSIGNLCAACFVGLGAYMLMNRFSTKNVVIYIVLCVLGNGLAFGVVTPILTAIFYGSELNVTFIQAIYGSLSNILVEVVVGLPVLYLLSKRTAARTNLEEE
ncbi:MAG: ECF transporter S component [Oscillospiraceae bacterium]|jgi:energy-coupling factor transport system substrate-specific component|nr:ECF transporter S component [Oscillospiraceae bacterium]MBQ3999364.1 ECF transporter S component [Oscillospiraceae bacterium]MBQ4239838.1 ECF transporter S component [Oscillospiraceae bacterium]